jgi:hypothetical protein
MLPQIADFLEREGGSVVAAFCLLVLASAMFMLKIPKAEDIILMAAGAIIAFLKGKASRPASPEPPKP